MSKLEILLNEMHCNEAIHVVIGEIENSKLLITNVEGASDTFNMYFVCRESSRVSMIHDHITIRDISMIIRKHNVKSVIKREYDV